MVTATPGVAEESEERSNTNVTTSCKPGEYTNDPCALFPSLAAVEKKAGCILGHSKLSQGSSPSRTFFEPDSLIT